MFSISHIWAGRERGVFSRPSYNPGQRPWDWGWRQACSCSNTACCWLTKQYINDPNNASISWNNRSCTLPEPVKIQLWKRCGSTALKVRDKSPFKLGPNNYQHKLLLHGMIYLFQVSPPSFRRHITLQQLLYWDTPEKTTHTTSNELWSYRSSHLSMPEWVAYWFPVRSLVLLK